MRALGRLLLGPLAIRTFSAVAGRLLAGREPPAIARTVIE
jgi:hypothetical protein